ncbi:MAG: [Lentisphaeria bacterium]|nr:[FeFe] hydrogenase H-cluster radical SAM maturase HydE [Lentisphaeria bacterium]
MKQFSILLDELQRDGRLSREAWLYLLQRTGKELRQIAAQKAEALTIEHFGNGVFVRGIVEFSNYCSNDCLYCGIRCSNKKAERYRLDEKEIIECCRAGFEYGFRTFVLQSGEDRFWNTGKLCKLVEKIKKDFPECAVTLSVGELSKSDFRSLFEAGADRYLLRHESADPEHFAMIHPPRQSWSKRMECLADLKDIGFQTGCGFMVGTPGQTLEHLAADMEFISGFQPHMVGIGPFIPHCDTPFADRQTGSAELTLLLLSLCRIMDPQLLLPATTALGTLMPEGRELGVLAGANVVMPNISPMEVRSKYSLYNNKNIADPGCAGVLKSELQKKLSSIGRKIVIGRGDHGGRSC